MRNDIKLPPDEIAGDRDEGRAGAPAAAGVSRPVDRDRRPKVDDPRRASPETRNSPHVEAREDEILPKADEPTVSRAVASDGGRYETPASRRSLLPHISPSIAAIGLVLLLLAFVLFSVVS